MKTTPVRTPYVSPAARRAVKALSAMLGEQTGQILPWVAVSLICLLGLAGLGIDTARVYVIRRQLQSATDAAALAGAQQMPDGDYSTVAKSFGSGSGNSNNSRSYTPKTAVVTPLCVKFLKDQGLPCTGTAAANALQIQQTAAVPMIFASLLGFKSLNITATSTSAMRGSKPLPYNVAVILDTTPSMDYSDTSCGSGATQLSCARGGVQQLLLNLAPTVDNVSLFTFPNITTTSVSNDFDCTSSNPTAGPYTFPSATASSLTNMTYKLGSTTVTETYQVTGFLSDYRTDNQATTLTTTSNLVKSVGGKTGCTGIQSSYENTYYAGAIYAAQSALTAEAGIKAGTQNVIILLSDGNATAKEQYPSGTGTFYCSTTGGYVSKGTPCPGINDMVVGTQSGTVATSAGTYPSWVGECSQAIDAATYAKGKGTKIYAISYGSPATSSSSNCGSDRTNSVSHPYLTPCDTMKAIASSTSTFYSDYYLPGSDTGCQASGPNNTITSLNSIFKTIAYDMTAVRLIPNGSATTTP
ncbi:MAG: hypothetical protein JST28_07680 [Acidobacteria bacterium]|nr:hypothetical protein [Acidobacteriota bacterium]